MGAPDIETWIASSTTSRLETDGDGDGDESVFTLERAREDWPATLQLAQRRLLSSKTKDRTTFLSDQLLSLTKNSGKLHALC